MTVGLRPQLIGRSGDEVLDLTIEIVEHLGNESFAYARQSGGQMLTLATENGRSLQPGQRIAARFNPAQIMVFDKSGQRIR